MQPLFAVPNPVDESHPINLTQYHDFLLRPWRANYESVVVIMDPYCPYCRKAAKKMSWLSSYNTYLLWSPVLGKRSEARVKEIVQCKQLNSRIVYDAIQKIEAPECNADKQADSQQQVKRFELIQTALKHYRPPAVPSFYYQDKRSSFSWLVNNRKLNQPVPKAQVSDNNRGSTDETGFAARPAIPHLSVDWSRYKYFLLSSSALKQPRVKSIAMVLDINSSVSVDVLNEIHQQQGEYRYYAFWATQGESHWIPQLPCNDDAELSRVESVQSLCQSDQEQAVQHNAEFILLANIEQLPAVYVDGYPLTLALLSKH